MKSKLFARILCIVLCLTIVVSIVLLAIPLLKGSAAAVPVKGGSGYITDDYVNLRSGPGINNPVVTVMMKNTAVTFEESVLYNSEWYKIKELKTNQSGYVNKDFVAAYNDEESPIKLGASKASTYKGCQYVFSQTGAVNPTWTSSNTSVATIDSRGILTAKSAGVTTITASENGNSARCTFTVMNGTSTGISNSSLNIPQGTSATLTASAGGVRWFSTNPAVATVSGGVVKAKSMGYTAISAYNSSGASTCLVQVTDPPQSSVVKISATAASTYTGCQYAFSQTGATNPVWASTNTSVATIDSHGVLTAKSAGTTTITVSEGSEVSYCKFTVMSGNSTGISSSSMPLILGSTAKLTASTSGVKWFSTNRNVATVSGGIVTAKGVGYATISAYTSGGASTCLVSVTSGALRSGINLSVTAASTYVGCQYAFSQTSASNPTWASSNPDVASVDGNGVATAKAAGVTTITVSEGNNIASCKFMVYSGTPTGISKSSLTIEKGSTETLSATASGVKWYTSNKNVAAVSGGVVTAKGLGYATISAYTSEGASTCLVHVVDAAPSYKSGYINTDDVNLRSGPGTNYSIVTSMDENTKLVFLSETLYNSQWYNVRLENGKEGYVYSSYVTKITPPTIKLHVSAVTTYKGCQYALVQTGATSPEWKSSDTSVCTVNSEGIVTAKSAGKATITVSQDGGSASCSFTVSNGTSTGISKTSLTLAQGKSEKLTALTSGVKWYSSNRSIATVSGGTVTAVGIGYATISAYTSTGASTCLVKVTQGEGAIKLNTTSISTYMGCQYAIGFTGTTSASWTSSNTSVATVNQYGVVTAKGVGTTTIKASNAASSATCTVSVKNGYEPGISASSATISSGKSILLKSDSSVNWSSSNTAIAAVGSNGVVDTKGTGYVTICAYTSYGASTCLLNVTAPDSIRFVYATPNSAPKNSMVSFKAITDLNRTAVKFVVSNGSTSYTVNASSKVKDGNTYVWTGSYALGISGKWSVKAYSKTSSTDFATTAENGEGEVFVTTSTDKTTTVLGERRASDEIINLIANYEGFLTSVTADYITSDPTVGYGKVVTTNEQFYNNLTKNEAYAYLCQTVNAGPYSVKTNDFLTSNNIKFNQRQFDAIVCFAYNVGAYAIYNDSSLQNVLLNTSGSGGSIKAGGSGYVNASGVNLRSGPGTSYSRITTMSQNTSFTFVDGVLYNSAWYKIKLSDNTVGYINSAYASSSSTTRDLANVNKDQLIARFLQYHHAAGSCYWGLLYRRVDEMEIFFYGDYARDGETNKYGMYFRCSNNSSFGIG